MTNPLLTLVGPPDFRAIDPADVMPAITFLVERAEAAMIRVGGGFVIVPALQRSTDLPMATSVAPSLALIFLVSLQSGLASPPATCSG